MGERVSVCLTVLATQSKEAKALFTFQYDDNYYNDDNDPLLNTFTFSEVNYGTLGFLPLLVAEGIVYDCTWEARSGWSEGTESCRFTAEGFPVVKTIDVDDINPSLESLLKLIDEPVALRNAILAHRDKVAVLPWDDQEAYGKLFRVNRLIGVA